jgi:hypothetical protein
MISAGTGGANNLNLPQKWAPFYIARNGNVTTTKM